LRIENEIVRLRIGIGIVRSKSRSLIGIRNTSLRIGIEIKVGKQDGNSGQGSRSRI
jgi:hypothetical protein